MLALLFSCIFIGAACGQTLVGKVSVVDNNGTSLYSFNENYVSGLELNVRVFVVNQDGEEVVSPVVSEDEPHKPVSVNVTCGLSPPDTGYSDVSFTTVQMLLSDENNTVPFTIVSAGRDAVVLCWGESDSTDPTAPSFTRHTSVGDTGELLIRPAGTVDICEAVTIVTSDTSSPRSILVELSEVVENGEAIVVCSSDVTGVVDPLNMTFTNTTFTAGDYRAQVVYTLVAPGNPVPVTCYAVSQPSPGVDNVQFYRENSTGSGSTFVEESVTVEMVPVLSQLRSTQMSAYLILSAPAITSVQFSCEVFVSENLDQARELSAIEGCVGDEILPEEGLSTLSSLTTDWDLQTSSTQAPTVNSSDGTWSLREPDIVFTETEYFKPVELYRQGDDLYTQPYRPEVVFVRCCSPGVSATPLYNNQSASFAAAVYLESNYSTNWDIATDPTNRTVETEIINPAYVDIAPCPCDLTERSCDVGCCCDDQCTEEDRETFTCIAGIQGGADSDETPRHLCTASYFGKPDWAPIMCVVTENSAFLGYFRQPEAAIRNRDDLTQRLEEYSDQYKYRQTETPFPLEDGSRDTGYKDGLSLKTGRQQQKVLEELLIGPNYRLVLPGQSASGQCVFSDPVAFLKESSESCVWDITEPICGAASPLNARNYALPTLDGLPDCRKGLLLLSEQGVREIAATNVDYHCADTAYLEQLHLPSLDGVWAGGDQVRLFDSGLPNNGQDCGFNELTGVYTCGNLTVGGVSPPSLLPPRCGWDDGFTPVPLPSLDNSSAVSVCTDSVLEVRYNFTWKGPRLVQLNATLVIGNIPLQQEKVENTTITYVRGNDTITETITNTTLVTTRLTQLSSVAWHHEMNASLYPDYQAQNDDPETENASVIFPRNNQVTSRSGKIGYELLLPVWSGISVYDAEDQFLYVDTNLSSQLSVWKPGPDSLCEGSGRAPVDFRQSALGSCLLRLDLETLNDCNNLRKLVLNKQDALMTSNYVGLSGDPDPENLDEDWRRVLRQDLSNITIETDPNATDVDPDKTYEENLVGRCENVPSHINVDIMYAEVGLNNGRPLHQITAARISYQLTTWSLLCTAADGTGCLGNTTEERPAVQSFILSSSVNFIQGPPRTPERKTRFQEAQSPGYFVCASDACWTEAFYPFRPGFEGDSYQYTLPVSLASLVFLLATFAISRPWW